MKEIRQDGKEGTRTGGIHEKSGGIQAKKDTEKKKYRKGWKQEGRVQNHDKRYAEQERCWTVDTGQEEKKSSVVFSSMFLMFFYFV